MKTSYEIEGDPVYKILNDKWPEPTRDLVKLPGLLLSLVDKPDGMYLKGVGGVPWTLGVPAGMLAKQLWERDKMIREFRQRQGLQQELEKAAK